MHHYDFKLCDIGLKCKVLPLTPNLKPLTPNLRDMEFECVLLIIKALGLVLTPAAPHHLFVNFVCLIEVLTPPALVL